MASLLALLSQRQPNLQTRKGLILTGLQNDFLSPDGKLPVSSENDYIDKIRELAPAFREYGDVIWVRSQYEADREVSSGIHEAGDNVIAGPLGDFTGDGDESGDDRDSPVPIKRARTSMDDLGRKAESPVPKEKLDLHTDEELFLSNTAQREACCMKGTSGAEFATQIKDVINAKDLQVTKTYYSAFGSTSLLLTLRSKLITELFVGGNMTNLSVFATAMDAARYGIKITLIEDCLGYRNKNRHEAAIKTLKDVMGADLMTAAQVIEALKNPAEEDDGEELTDEEDEEEDDIVVGESAAGVPVQSLQLDSDGEEEFALSSTVRPLPSRPAHSTAGTADLQTLLSGPECASEPRRPPNHTARTASNPIDDHRKTTESGLSSDENRLKPGLDRLSGLSPSSVKSDDSSQSHKIKASMSFSNPSVGSIGIEWKTRKERKHSQVAQSTNPGLGAIAALVGLDQRTVNEYEAMMNAFKGIGTECESSVEGRPLLGEGSEEESAGSRIFCDLLPSDLVETVFDQLKHEVNWQHMHHQTGEVPRLVCCQGSIGEDGSMPVYRHPSDQTLPIASWTATVDKVRKAAEKVVGHPLNHALIQLYRGGNDFISEHSDKTLDIAKDSFIVNVSFGAQRTMRLRTKRGATASTESASPPARTTHRVPLPHNSMITMSLPTNARYLHGINPDKRPRSELTDAEKAYDGQRISLTFRHIATFLNADSARIWGQGATGKTKESATVVVNGDAKESERLVRAFGAENQASQIEWERVYGGGSDVLHLK